MLECVGFWDFLIFFSGGDKDFWVVFVMVYGFVIWNDLFNYFVEFDEFLWRWMDVF